MLHAHVFKRADRHAQTAPPHSARAIDLARWDGSDWLAEEWRALEAHARWPTQSHAFAAALTPLIEGQRRKLLGLRVEEFAPMAEGEQNELRFDDGATAPCDLWADVIDLEGASALATFTGNFYAGRPAITEHRYRALADRLRSRLGELTGYAQQFMFFDNVQNWRQHKRQGTAKGVS